MWNDQKLRRFISKDQNNPEQQMRNQFTIVPPTQHRTQPRKPRPEQRLDTWGIAGEAGLTTPGDNWTQVRHMRGIRVRGQRGTGGEGHGTDEGETTVGIHSLISMTVYSLLLTWKEIFHFTFAFAVCLLVIYYMPFYYVWVADGILTTSCVWNPSLFPISYTNFRECHLV